jgi:sporulation protein YlmC with PRC-barrel domain
VTRLVRAAELIGRPVLTLDEAKIIGEVRDVLFDPHDSRITGFTLRGRGLLSPSMLGLVPIERVRSVGSAAVMVHDAAALLRDADEQREYLPERQDATGTEVVAEDGTPIGLVSDIVIETDGEQLMVVGYCLEREEDSRELIVPAPEGPREWGEAIVVPADVERQAIEGLVGFSTLLERIRRERAAEPAASVRQGGSSR